MYCEGTSQTVGVLWSFCWVHTHKHKHKHSKHSGFRRYVSSFTLTHFYLVDLILNGWNCNFLPIGHTRIRKSVKNGKTEDFHFHNYLGLFNLVLLEVPLAASKALGSWVSLYKLCKHEQFIPFFLIDPLKLCQIGRAASLNCHRQVFPQMMHEPCPWREGGEISFRFLFLSRA